MSFDNLPKTDPIILPASPEVLKSPKSEWMGQPKTAAHLRTAPSRVEAPRLAELCPAEMPTGGCAAYASSSMTVA